MPAPARATRACDDDPHFRSRSLPILLLRLQVLETLLLAQREPYMRLSVAERIGPGYREARDEAAHYQGSLGMARRRIRRMEPELERLRRITKGREPSALYSQVRAAQELAQRQGAAMAHAEDRLALANDELALERERGAADLSVVRSLRAENANLRLSVAHTVALRRIRRQDAVIADLKVIGWTTPQGSPHESLRAQP